MIKVCIARIVMPMDVIAMFALISVYVMGVIMFTTWAKLGMVIKVNYRGWYKQCGDDTYECQKCHDIIPYHERLRHIGKHNYNGDKK